METFLEDFYTRLYYVTSILDKNLTYLKKYVKIKISSLAIGSNRIPGRQGEIVLGGLGLL